MVSDILTRETREWNRARIDNLMPELTLHIMSLRPSILTSQDAYVWPLNSSEVYSAKSGYNALITSKSRALTYPRLVNWDWKKNLWNPPLLPKIKIFLWKVLHNAISTGENLQKWGMLTNTLCSRCGAVGTQEHLFFQCSFARQVWELAPWSSHNDFPQATTFAAAFQSSYLQKNLPPYGPRGTNSSLIPRGTNSSLIPDLLLHRKLWYNRYVPWENENQPNYLSPLLPSNSYPRRHRRLFRQLQSSVTRTRLGNRTPTRLVSPGSSLINQAWRLLDLHQHKIMSPPHAWLKPSQSEMPYSTRLLSTTPTSVSEQILKWLPKQSTRDHRRWNSTDCYQTSTPLSFQPLRLLFFASLFSFPVRPMGLRTS